MNTAEKKLSQQPLSDEELNTIRTLEHLYRVDDILNWQYLNRLPEEASKTQKGASGKNPPKSNE